MWFYFNWVYQWQCLKYAVDTIPNLKNILFKKIFEIYQWECIVVFRDTLENVNEVLKTIQWKIIFQNNISLFSNWILSPVKFCVMWIDEVIVKFIVSRNQIIIFFKLQTRIVSFNLNYSDCNP